MEVCGEEVWWRGRTPHPGDLLPPAAHRLLPAAGQEARGDRAQDEPPQVGGVRGHLLHLLPRKAKMSWTQGVEGLNTRRKEQRRGGKVQEETEEAFEVQEGEVGVQEGCEVLVVKGEGGVEASEEVVLEHLYFVQEEVASTQEVELGTVVEEEAGVAASQEGGGVRVINTYLST